MYDNFNGTHLRRNEETVNANKSLVAASHNDKKRQLSWALT